MIKRRHFLAAPALAAGAQTPARRGRPRVACILNTYFPNSHADVFMGRLLFGYRLNGKSYQPAVDVASLYVDQFPVNDMAREQAEEYGVTIYPSIAGAMRLGGSKIAVDGVAIIGEHGNYPRTPRGNIMYPRWKFFDQATTVMREDGRVVPLFNDKYFAYEWGDAEKMYRRVKEMRIPFMCGSTLPLTWRRPPLQFPGGVQLEELLAVSFSDIEEHGYHAIELMQAMAERRGGGETGVEAVRCVEGEEVWELARRGDWSRDLMEAALSRRVNPPPDKQRFPLAAIQVKYRDGLKGTVLNLDGQARDYLFAAREKGRAEPHSSCFYIQLYNHNHWGFMVRDFEDLVLSGRPANLMERTYLSTGILLYALESRLQGQKWISTPQLAIRY
ncbi:MAG: hypothetical protein IPM24_10550 [Bryobacterales bacterium]|nr:hypothetical protein [Bryobacterales bacterium]